MSLIASVVFVLGYLSITLEHKINTNKSAVALLLGSILWMLLAMSGAPNVSELLRHAGSDIFEILIFLLAAMSLVEVLAHYKFFDIVRGRLYSLGLSNKKQFILITLLTFFLSALLDNLTTTIVMVQIARKFFKGDALIPAIAGIMIATNAGGAFSPIGDVTTIMLWLSGKFTSLEILKHAFLPSFLLYVVAIALLLPRIKNHRDDASEEIVVHLSTTEKIVIWITFISFILPVVVNVLFGLPPYFGRLIGLGVVWLAIDIFKQVRPHKTHLGASIEQFLKQTDIASLQFFLGILLSVAALHAFGALDFVSTVLYGTEPTVGRIIASNTFLGVISAVLDNVPLAAIALQVLHVESASIWSLLAITLGTGGSIFIIGSAAGIVAMGMIKELTFGQYLKVATLPALVGLLVAVGVWSIQYFVFGF